MHFLEVYIRCYQIFIPVLEVFQLPRLTLLSQNRMEWAQQMLLTIGNGAFDLSTDDITYTIRADFDQPVYIGGRDLSYDQQGFEFISATSIQVVIRCHYLGHNYKLKSYRFLGRIHCCEHVR